MSMRDRLETHESRETRYWGAYTELCVLIGCAQESHVKKLKAGCFRCGGGPYHWPCLQKHLAWCHYTVSDEGAMLR